MEDQPNGQQPVEPIIPPAIIVQPEVQQDNAQNNNNVSRIQVRVPPFWKQNPELWFRQIEAQFANANIVNDVTKYNTIVGVMESDILSSVSDIVINPPQANKYRAIKDRLTKQFAETDTKKIKSLLNEITLGDRKPSDLLRKMKELACGKVGDELLKTLWLHRLPINVQIVLSTSEDGIEQLASMADSMMEITDFTNIQAIESNRNSVQNLQQDKKLDDLVNVVCQLEGKIESLKKSFGKSSKRGRHTARSRSPTPSKTQAVSSSKLCYYHKNFGKNATKCKKPCDFTITNSEN